MLFASAAYAGSVPPPVRAVTPYTTYSALHNAAAPSDGAIAQTAGYWSAGDGGAAEYVYSASSTASTLGPFIFAPPSNVGRWFMQIPSTGIHPEAAGSKCDYSFLTLTGTDDTLAFNLMRGSPLVLAPRMDSALFKIISISSNYTHKYIYVQSI